MKPTIVNLLKFPIIIIIIWMIVFVGRLIPIVGEWHSLDGFTWFIILVSTIVYFFAMFAGIFQSFAEGAESVGLSNNSYYFNRWIRRLCIFSILGAALIIYEFAIMRKYGFSTSIAQIRQTEVTAAIDGFGGSWISGAGRMLTPALMVAWVLAMLSRVKIQRSTLILLLLASITVFYQQKVFEGGRVFLAALLLMTFFASSIRRYFGANGRINARRTMIWGVLFIFSIVFFGAMFADRYEQADRDFFTAYVDWVNNFDLSIDENITYSRLSGMMAGVWLGISMLWAYMTQGFNEMNILFQADQMNHAWGLMQFPQIGQALSKLFGFELKYDVFRELPHAGTYLTLYGASYIDFGYSGALVFMAIVGWLTGRAIRAVYGRNLTGVAINAPLLMTLGVFSPIVSLVVNLWPAFVWALLVGYYTKKFNARQIATSSINSNMKTS